jgi:uncharacterized protein (DUF1778 family)
MSTWKGYRKRLELRFPPELADQIRESAAREGVSVNDWCVGAMMQRLVARGITPRGYVNMRPANGKELEK